jgi:hypothetical protein
MCMAIKAYEEASNQLPSYSDVGTPPIMRETQEEKDRKNPKYTFPNTKRGLFD